MQHPRTGLPLSRSFHSLGLRTRVVLCQLPLVCSMLVVVAVGGFVDPGMSADPWFRACLILHAVVLALCALIPWERLPARSFQLVPVADFVLIGLLLRAEGPGLSGLGLLLVFPVIWLSVSVLKSRILISFAGSLAAVLIPVSSGGQDLDLLRLILTPAIMLAISVSVHIVANNLEFQRRQLADTEARLRRVLQASRRREQLLHAIVDSIDVGLVALDARGCTTLVNRQQEAFGIRASVPGGAGSPDLQGEGGHIYDADGVTFLPPHERPLHRAVAEGELSGQLIWLGEGPQRIAVSASAHMISGDQGEAAGSVVLFKDVTAQLAQLAAKDDFMSGISHELRTPLTSILAYLELAMEHPELPARVAGYLGVADRNARRLLALISDFLSATAGTLSIRPEPADLAEVLRASVLSAVPRAAAAGITVAAEVDGEIIALIDAARMGQVVDNLLSNAVKYSPAGSTVTVRGRQQAGGSVLEVADTGYGMDAADRARVFERFFRADSVRSSGIPGTGLGLVVSKDIVELHGGTIEVSSDLGAGTTVRVTLPGAAENGAAPSAAVPGS